MNIFRSIYFRLMSANKLAKVLGVKFGKNCNFRTKEFGSEPYLIKVGDNVRVAAEVRFITHDGALYVLRHMYDKYQEADLFKPIIMGNNVWIGLGAIILPGTKIGNNVIVGAGSVVRGKLESNSVYAGVPVKYICSLKEFENKNAKDFINTKNLTGKQKKTILQNKFKHILE